MLKLALLFTVVPLVELYLLLLLGDAIGFWPTVAIVAVTGVTGAWLAKREGLRVLRKWQGSLRSGKMPEEGVLGGVLVLVGGVLLVTPGVLTDCVGFSLLIPPSRRAISRVVRKVLEARMDDGTIQVVGLGGGAGARAGGVPFGDLGDASRQAPPRNVVMDVEGEVVEPTGATRRSP